jgi:hypothetical protein
MKIKRILLAIPLIIVIGYLIDCWIEIASRGISILWQHYVAIFLLAVVIYFFLKDFTKAVISTGIFLLAGTFNLFSMTADINTTTVRIGSVELIPFNSLSLGLFFLFVVLNLETMINLHLDYKEMKNKKNNLL